MFEMFFPLFQYAFGRVLRKLKTAATGGEPQVVSSRPGSFPGEAGDSMIAQCIGCACYAWIDQIGAMDT